VGREAGTLDRKGNHIFHISMNFCNYVNFTGPVILWMSL
jgi:hypothetical protein